MKTLRLKDGKADICRAAEILKNGGIVAIPTETVYGLAASAFDGDAIDKVFIAKGRPQDNPLIVHISDMEMLEDITCDVPNVLYTLAEKFWPGPLTLVLPCGDKVSKKVTAGLETVAVRMPSSAVARDIIKETGLPLAAPSANISGSPSPTSAEHVLSDLDGKIDAVVMSENSRVGVESTVVTLSTNPPRLLRPGGVTAEQLKEFLPDLVLDSAVLAEPEKDKPVASPGMKYKHYSPKTKILLVEAKSDDFANFVNKEQNCGAICFSEDEKLLSVPHIVYGKADDDASQAAGLFDALRAADTLSAEKVYVHAPQKSGVGLAVYNRLIRAAGFEVIDL